MKRLLLIAALLFLSQAAWATPTFILIPPDGLIGGAPGATIGWGLQIENPDNDYLVVSLTDFVHDSGAFLGAYTDILAAGFTIIGPGTTIIPYDVLASTGLGSYTLNPAVTLGDLEVGTIRIFYNAYSDSGASVPTVPTDPTYRADLTASVLVVPEPATVGVVASALLACGVWRRRKRRS